MSTLPTDWSENGEGKWDKAVADIVKQLESGGGFSKNEQGHTVLNMTAFIVVRRNKGV